MEKSGSWNSTPCSLIIDRPDLQSWSQRAISGALTTFFWLLWFALWMPLLTLTGWAFFGWQFNVHMFDLGGIGGFVERISIYAAIIFLISARWYHITIQIYNFSENIRFGLASVLATALIFIVLAVFGLMRLVVKKSEHLEKTVTIQ